jgi:hypothetical protein
VVSEEGNLGGHDGWTKSKRVLAGNSTHVICSPHCRLRHVVERFSEIGCAPFENPGVGHQHAGGVAAGLRAFVA